jgi:hypothetical protein
LCPQSSSQRKRLGVVGEFYVPQLEPKLMIAILLNVIFICQIYVLLLELKLNIFTKVEVKFVSPNNAKPLVARSAFHTSFCQTKFFYLLVLLNATSQKTTAQKRCV